MLPTTCLLCHSPVIKNYSILQCHICKNDDVRPYFKIFLHPNDNSIIEYVIFIPSLKYIINSSKINGEITLIYNYTDPTYTAIVNKYIEYKHDLDYLTNRFSALLLLA